MRAAPSHPPQGTCRGKLVSVCSWLDTHAPRFSDFFQINTQLISFLLPACPYPLDTFIPCGPTTSVEQVFIALLHPRLDLGRLTPQIKFHLSQSLC